MSRQLYTLIGDWEIWIEDDKIYAEHLATDSRYEFPSYEIAVSFAELN